MLDVDAVATGEDLVNQQTGLGALDVEHPTVAGGGRRAGEPRAPCECGFRLAGKGAEAHARDHERDFELDRFGREPRAQDRAGSTGFAVAFERDAGQRAGEEREVVKGCPDPFPQRPETADAIPGELGLDLDIFDHRGAEGCRNRRGRRVAAVLAAVSAVL